jgi:hypothetical protein
MPMTKLLKTFCHSAVVAAVLGGTLPAAQAESVDFEYKLKAVFLLNFAKFISWPTTSFANEAAELNICVVGDDPFGNVLDQVVRGETVQKHPLAVVRPAPDRGLQTCHIAFFSRAIEAHAGNLIAKHVSANTLTVGDNDTFLRQGGMFNFVLEETKVRFIINSAALGKSSLNVSSKLLSLGRTATD